MRVSTPGMTAVRDSATPRACASVYDVIIIGGGIVGTMIARELSKYKGRFALLEKETATGFGVSKANVSMLHSPLMFPSGPVRLQLAYRAAARYKRLAKELEVVFREVDEMFVVFDQAQLSGLETARLRAEERGLSANHVFIGPDKVREVEPHLNPKAIGALYGKGVGGIYAPEWAFALIENAVQNGLHLHLNTPVTAIRKVGDFDYLLTTPKGMFKARYIVNAAGLFADEIGRMVGDGDIGLILTKGTMAILDKSVSYLVRNMVYGTFGRDHSQLITPTAHGNLLLGLGSFVTPEDKNDTRVSRQKLGEVMDMARELVPAISEKHVITSFAGIRSDNTKAAVPGDFYIAPSEHAPGVIHAVIGSPGLTAAPAIAEMMIKLLSDSGMALEEKRDFHKERRGWSRFEKASMEQRAALVAQDPKYGKVVCRCEQVTEAEILEAIRRGADTMDGVKHLTRAGMGRCQGGFCGVSVLKYLSKQLGIPPAQVTKKGGGSYQVTESRRGGGHHHHEFF
jgi:glycerol-3-phosphate dehydrogenase